MALDGLAVRPDLDVAPMGVVGVCCGRAPWSSRRGLERDELASLLRRLLLRWETARR